MPLGAFFSLCDLVLLFSIKCFLSLGLQTLLRQRVFCPFIIYAKGCVACFAGTEQKTAFKNWEVAGMLNSAIVKHLKMTCSPPKQERFEKYQKSMKSLTMKFTFLAWGKMCFFSLTNVWLVWGKRREEKKKIRESEIRCLLMFRSAPSHTGKKKIAFMARSCGQWSPNKLCSLMRLIMLLLWFMDNT